MHFSRKTRIIIIIVIGLIGVGLLGAAAGLYFGFINEDAAHLNGSEKAPYTAGVVTNGYECASIGASILLKNGSAVDAAIASLFCEGVAMPQSMGLGGGFLMTIYIKETREVFALNAREMAPGAAYEDMFNGNGSLSSKGGLAVAVPGDLRGYWYAHQRFGKLPWADLVQPTIDLCENGHLVTPYLAALFKSREQTLLASPTLRDILINPATNQTYEVGHLLKRPQLAQTLRVIAVEGADGLYNGSLTLQFVKDIQAQGGIITTDDMNRYVPEWRDPVIALLPDNHTLYSSPLPGTGVILAFIMNVLSGYLDHSQPELVTNWQRIIESFKHGYGKRTELGDMNYVDIIDLVSNLTSPEYAQRIRLKIADNETHQDPEYYGANTTSTNDHGTAHISVMASNGDAVSVTGTINLYFGAGFRSMSTGIIVNDEMDDFSAPNITNSFGVPPSPANYIRPYKRPLSSMCPTIIVDKNGDVQLVIGAAGGTKITTSIALVTMKHMWFGQPLQESLNDRRCHHQLFPMAISFESNFTQSLMDGLAQIGHNISIADPDDGFAALTALSKFNGSIVGGADPRRFGQIVLI